MLLSACLHTLYYCQNIVRVETHTHTIVSAQRAELLSAHSGLNGTERN